MTDVESINGAQLKVRLEGLGLLPAWFGAHMGKTMRTVVRWFDGGTMPPEVVPELDKLSERTLERMLEILEEVPDEGPVTLHTYRTDFGYARAFPGQNWPASWHRALIFRVREHLISSGRDVTIEYE